MQNLAARALSAGPGSLIERSGQSAVPEPTIGAMLADTVAAAPSAIPSNDQGVPRAGPTRTLDRARLSVRHLPDAVLVDDTKAARGAIAGIVLGITIWAVILGLVFFLSR